MHRRIPLAIALLSMGMVASSCNDMMTAGGSDEIDTSVGRVAVDRTGRPVAYARVALVRSGDSTGRPLAVSAADSIGGLPAFRVPDGYYGLLLRDPGDSIGRFVDSLEVESGALPAGRDTLLSLGVVRGVVRVAPGHSPATVTLGLIGTDILANVHDDGTFRIELVPGGVYTLAAFPSLEGYGPLYRRIQLKDGQNLVLADTLVMPFTGMPAPGGVVVAQDTATGDVVVKWNRVVHPDLYGYLVEVLEGGAVVRSRFLQDSSWVDSLGVDWVKQALFGPWKDRKLVYRISSRSRSGAPDVKTAAPEFVAHPPAWTARIDSVKLRIDTLPNGDAEVSWNRLAHPALRGWVVERWTGGTLDCSGEASATDTVWMDSSCPERGWEAIDSGWSSHPRSKGLLMAKTTTYTLSAKRSLDGREGYSPLRYSVAEAELDPPASPMFEGSAAGSWKRVALAEPYFKDHLFATSGWLVHAVGPRRPNSRGRVHAISRDGLVWESVDKGGLAVGSEDSLWVVRPRVDSMGVVWERRTGAGAWVADSISLPFAVGIINWVVRDAHGFVLGLQQYTGNIMLGNYRSIRVEAGNWSLLDSAMEWEPAQDVSAQVRVGASGGYDVLVGSYYPSSSRIFHTDTLPAMPLYMTQSGEIGLDVGPSAPVGVWGSYPTSLFWCNHSDESEVDDITAMLAMMDSTGTGRVVRLPAGAGMPALRGNELWVPVGETLWKGTIVTR